MRGLQRPDARDRGEPDSPAGYWLQSYAYDEIGNSTRHFANNLNQYTEFDYDLDGNMTTNYNTVMTYDAQSRLSSVSTLVYTNNEWRAELLVSNRYDHIGRRVKKISPDKESTFFYDGWNLIEERVAYTNGNSTTFRYYWGKDLPGSLQGAGGVGGLLYLTISTSNIEHQTPNSSTPNSSTQLFIPCYDNNGNVTRYLDANGATVAQYSYDAFGNLLNKSGAMCDVFRHLFSTKYYDIETELYYYGYRFYCPWLMRWINRDPIEEVGGMNLYAACANAMSFRFDILGKDNGTVIVEGLGAGWAGSTITLNGRTAVQLNEELFYLTMTHQQGMYIPKGGSTSSLYLFKAGNVTKGLRLDYHEIPVHSNNPPEWHINVDGGQGSPK